MQVYVQNEVYNMVITGDTAGLVKYRQVQSRMWYTLHVDSGHTGHGIQRQELDALI